MISLSSTECISNKYGYNKRLDDIICNPMINDTDDSGNKYYDDEYQQNQDGEDEDLECILEKLREILANHRLLDKSHQTVDGLLHQIENLCKNVDEYNCENYKFFRTSQRNKRLKNENEKLENTLQGLEDEHDRLKQEYLRLKQQNEDLIETLNNYPSPNEDGSDVEDVLQLNHDINDNQERSMYEPLGDLANDSQSDDVLIIKDILSKLNKSGNDINNLEKSRLYLHEPLTNIIESNIDDIGHLLKSEPIPMNGAAEQMDMKYPELIYDADDAKLIYDVDHSDLDADNDGWKGVIPRRGIEFDANYPFVKRIEIDGNWFNKKIRAIIEWNGCEFKRKMADFKWLHRMLLLNGSADRVVPEYLKDSPEFRWNKEYLMRRKRELNLFLMQCHSLPWIKNYKVYNDIFLEINKKRWKQERNQYNQDIIDRIKHHQSTYDKSRDVINN